MIVVSKMRGDVIMITREDEFMTEFHNIVKLTIVMWQLELLLEYFDRWGGLNKL